MKLRHLLVIALGVTFGTCQARPIEQASSRFVIARAYNQMANPFGDVVRFLAKKGIRSAALPHTPPLLYVKSRNQALRAYRLLSRHHIHSDRYRLYKP